MKTILSNIMLLLAALAIGVATSTTMAALALAISPDDHHGHDQPHVTPESTILSSRNKPSSLVEDIAVHMDRDPADLVSYTHSNPEDLSAHYALAIHNGVVTPEYFETGQHLIDHGAHANASASVDASASDAHVSARKHDLIGFRDMGFYYFVPGCPASAAMGYRGDPGQYYSNNLPEPSKSVYSFMSVFMFPKWQCRSSDGTIADGHACGELHDPDRDVKCVQNR